MSLYFDTIRLVLHYAWYFGQVSLPAQDLDRWGMFLHGFSVLLKDSFHTAVDVDDAK